MTSYPSWFNPSLKVLTVCEGGNVRSVAMMHALHGHPHHPLGDVIAVGAKVLSIYSWSVFGEWADVILVVGQEEILTLIPSQYMHKVYHVNIGPDHWGIPTNPDLIHNLQERIYHEKGLRNALGWET